MEQKTLDHLKEDAIHQLVLMKERVEDTIKLLDKVDTYADFFDTMLDNPLMEHLKKDETKD